MNHKRVERIWRREGLKVPQKQPKPGRLWLTDGSCVRHRPTHRIHIWAYDFVAVWTKAGRPLKLLTIVDEYTRECLAIDVYCRLRSDDVLHRFSQLFVQDGAPEQIRSDNGSEFAAKAVREGLHRVGHRPCSLNPVVPGRMAMSKVLTANCGTNCSMARSSKRVGKPRCSSNAGGAPRAINHRLPRPGNLGTLNVLRLRDVVQQSWAGQFQCNDPKLLRSNR